MTNAQTSTLVFKSDAGDYFLVPQTAFEDGRVPAEHRAEVERLLAAADPDVSGYVVATTYTLVRVINAGAKALGDFVAGATPGDAALLKWLEGQLISGGPA